MSGLCSPDAEFVACNGHLLLVLNIRSLIYVVNCF